MRSINIIAVSEPGTPWQELLSTYQRKLSAWVRVQMVIIEQRHDPRKQQQAIEKQLQSYKQFIICDEHGKQFTSIEFSRKLDDLFSSLGAHISILIGPADGLAEQIRNRALLSLSLSPLTFGHELALLVLYEQLYRAFSIMHRHPYHRS